MYIRKYDWTVAAFFDVMPGDADGILAELRYMSCPSQTMARVARNLERGEMDTGFTFSNRVARCSVMNVGHASSPAEFLNSYTHELRHLVDDIASASFLPMRGEGVGYLTGELSWEFWNEIHDLVCCRCQSE